MRVKRSHASGLGMLAAELGLAVAPAAVGDDARRCARRRRPHRRRLRRRSCCPRRAIAGGIDVGARGQEGDGGLGVLDLLEADDARGRALALAAAAEIEAQRGIAPIRQHARRLDAVAAALVAAEAVQHENGRMPLARAVAGGKMHHAGKLERSRLKRDALFHAQKLLVVRLAQHKAPPRAAQDHGLTMVPGA